MSRKKEKENVAFICEHCSKHVVPLTNGSYRNHCPKCLHSVHVDDKPGDRNSHCYGLMKPIGIHYHSQKGWQIIHHCSRCNKRGVNSIADNTVQEDDWDAVIKLGQIF